MWVLRPFYSSSLVYSDLSVTSVDPRMLVGVQVYRDSVFITFLLTETKYLWGMTEVGEPHLGYSLKMWSPTRWRRHPNRWHHGGGACSWGFSPPHILSEQETEGGLWASRVFFEHQDMPFREKLLPASLYLPKDSQTPERATPVLDQVLKQLVGDISHSNHGVHPHPSTCPWVSGDSMKSSNTWIPSVLLIHQLGAPASSTAARAVYHHVDAPAWGKGSAGK